MEDPMRRNLIGLLLVLAAAGPAAGETSGVIYKDPDCQCCIKWVEHMARAGFVLEPRNVNKSQLVREKVRLGLSLPQASCHTAEIGGYVVEGHVPADDVKRLLAEKPDAIGLAVPRMPVGSPGMEVGDTKEPYEVLLIKKDGSTEVFAKH
jgi:hypothetical protein